MKKIVCYFITVLLVSFMLSSMVFGAQKPSLQTTKKNIVIAETYSIKINNLPKSSTVSYASSKSSIAKVDKNGKVTGITAGKAKITVSVKTTKNTYSLYLTVTVKAPGFSEKNGAMMVGEVKNLKISNKPKKGATYTWKSSNTKVAAVSNGTVKAKKVGTAKISVLIKTSKKTYTLNYQLTVNEKTKTEADYLKYLSNISQKHTKTDGEMDSTGALEDVVNTAKEGMQNGIIKDYDKNNDGVSVEFSSGIVFVYQKPDTQVDAAGAPDKIDIITLQPYLSSYGSDDKTRSTKATDNAALKISDQLGYAYFTKNYDNNAVSLKTITNIGSNEIILLHSHGFFNESYGSVLWIGETATDSDFNPGGLHYDDLCSKRLVLTEGRRFGITSAYVNKYCNKMNNTFLYLATCYSGKDSRLAYSFINKGASAVIANSESIYRHYNLDMMEDVLDGLLNKGSDGYNTLETALKKAKTLNGNDDSEWYRNNFSGSSNHAPATPILFGNKKYKFTDSATAILPTGINISKSDVSLKRGEKLSLTATVIPSDASDKTVTWESDNIAVATVSGGTITAVSGGTANIYAKTTNGLSASCRVTVKNDVINPTSITISTSNISITVGDTFQLSATISPSNATDKTVTWSSDNTGVATVNNGTVKAVSSGTTNIYAKTSNGYKASCLVTVKQETNTVNVTFSHWENSTYTYIGTTDASIGQHIYVSDGNSTATGMYLYDANGNHVATAHQDTYYHEVYFKINKECGYTLSPNTTYKYKFYVIVDGKTYWGSLGTFTTLPVNISVSFENWSDDRYTYIRDTDASIGQHIYVSGGNCSATGMYLYDSDGNHVATANQNHSDNSWKEIYFKINEECGYALRPGRLYKYKFYAIVNGTYYWSNMQSFTTAS